MNTLVAKIGATRLVAAAVAVAIFGLVLHQNWLVVAGMVMFVLVVLASGGT